ncbi:MAG: exodeoxyribonuclease VII large subunit [Burkholderiales bacterium]
MTMFERMESPVESPDSSRNPQEDELATAQPIAVSALVRSVRDLLEHRYRLVWVTGEISNLTMARSGHWYFILKDAAAQVRCVMFRHRNLYLDWTPKEGMQVEARALVTLYEARGEFQLSVEFLRQAGRGSLFEAFLKLRDKLQSEGLFDASAKRPLPDYPQTIGVITSPHAAALRDIIATIRSRNPSQSIIVYPASVQGERAAREIIAAIQRAAERRECAVLVIARGGGSIEDLWCFNDEGLARAMRACPIPIVSGVGHETDFTIADFAADVRAPTPTAAATLVSPSRQDLVDHVLALANRLTTRIIREIERRMQALDYLQRALGRPGRRVLEKRNALSRLASRLERSIRDATARDRIALAAVTRTLAALLPELSSTRSVIEHRVHRLRHAFANRIALRRFDVERLGGALRHLDPIAVLARGYSITRDASGEVVVDASAVATGEMVEVTLARGQLQARVEGSKP